MKRITFGSIGFTGKFSLKRSLLFCGILSCILYVAMNIFIPMFYKGYSILSQTVSELSAVGAPTRALWNPFVILYEVLLIAFGWGILKSNSQNSRLRVVGALFIAYGIISLRWPFAPLHQREALAAGKGNISDTFHLVLSAVTGLFYLLALGFGALALGKKFRLINIATFVGLIVFTVLMSIESPKLSQNLPTPLLGIWERINIGIFLIWVAILAYTLLRSQREHSSYEIAGTK